MFTLDIRSDSIASVAIALGILQDELPAETSFYLPESFHRKIIGRNGKNIQEIMYKHNVAVRFSSKEQWAEFGGHEGEPYLVRCLGMELTKCHAPYRKRG